MWMKQLHHCSIMLLDSNFHQTNHLVLCHHSAKLCSSFQSREISLLGYCLQNIPVISLIFKLPQHFLSLHAQTVMLITYFQAHFYAGMRPHPLMYEFNKRWEERRQGSRDWSVTATQGDVLCYIWQVYLHGFCTWSFLTGENDISSHPYEKFKWQPLFKYYQDLAVLSFIYLGHFKVLQYSCLSWKKRAWLSIMPAFAAQKCLSLSLPVL